MRNRQTGTTPGRSYRTAIAPGLRRTCVLAMLGTVLLLGGCGGPKASGLVGGGGTPNDGVLVTLYSNADWVAFQDGQDSPWTHIGPDTSGGVKYSLWVSDPNGDYGVAVHRNSSATGTSDLTIAQANVHEASTIYLGINNDALGTVKVAVTGIASNAAAIVGVPGEFANVATDGTATLKTWHFPASQAIIFQGPAPAGTGTAVLSGTEITNIPIGSGTTNVNADLSSPTLTVDTTDGPYALTGALNSDFVAIYAPSGAESCPINPTTHVFRLINGLASSDMYVVGYNRTTTTDGGPEYLSVFEFYGASSFKNTLVGQLGDIDLPTINPFTGSMNGTGLSRLSWSTASTLSGFPQLDSYVFIANQKPSTGPVTVKYIVTNGWLSQGGTVSPPTTYTFPDFSSVSGYKPRWNLSVGTGTVVNATGSGEAYNKHISYLDAAARPAPVPGEQYWTAYDAITFTP